MTNGWDRKARRLAAETFGLDYEEMNERHHLTFDTYEVGKLTLDEYLDRIVFYEERSFTMDTFRTFMFDQSRALPDMIELVTRLKARHGLKIAAVSNEGRELNEYRIRTYKLGRCIDFFISSSFIHYRKPDADIFRIALDIAQVAPEEVFYIDDRPMFVDVASNLGIQGMVHTTYEQTRDMLASVGLI